MTVFHLVDVLQQLDINTFTVSEDLTICFAHPIRYDLLNNKLVVID